jgi:aminopeptidase N
MTKRVKRLYKEFHPSNYQLSVTPDAKKMSFRGTVTISGTKIGKPSKRLTFHQNDLVITKATIVKHSKKDTLEKIAVERINTHKTYNEVRLHTDEMIYPGEYTISLEFQGVVKEQSMQGLYPCYFEHNGQKKVLLATQFESHYARDVFPCIDEPEAKATFNLSLTTPASLVTLSNTPVLSETVIANDKKLTTFETTPIMSTYLLAFIIGEMHCVETKTKDGIVICTWASVAHPQKFLEYANSEAVVILDFFTDYFQTPFPLKKLDQVALPDFEAGAMENWGLITYREVALLADPNNRSQSSEQYVSMVIGHELSHQWFGNLVTMRWWDDLWLNESFASFMEHIALDALHPDWFQWEQYTASDVIICSSRDIFKDVQSVRIEVNHPDEISTIFDGAIVYAKGGRLLKMMREYIGDTAFRAGLKSYFARHAYSNTTRDDLWLEMSSVSKKDINSFMDPWLEQSGMPVVGVTHKADTIDLTQKRFVLDADNDASLWPVPMLANQPTEIDVLTSPSATISRPSATPVIINQYGSGHMLAHYTDKATRDYLAQSFKNEVLTPESRINILNDQLLLARGGVAPLTDSLDIIKQASAEPREAVWLIMSRTIGTAMNLTEGDEETEKNIKAFRRKLATQWYGKLGWDDKETDSPNTKSLRQTILSIMVGSEDKAAQAEALRRYKAAKTVDDLPAEQRPMIVSAVVRIGEDVVDSLIEQYKTSPNPDIQLAICAGLTNTKDGVVGDYIIKQALGKDGFVRPQDIFRWFAYLMRNRYTRESTWNWLVSDWDRLEALFGDGKSFEYFVMYSASPINTADWQKKFVNFFEPKSDMISLKRNIAIAKSEIKARIAWRKREESSLKEYFKK